MTSPKRREKSESDAGEYDLRRALPKDLAEAGQLAAVMVRMHHAWDPQRFSLLSDSIEEGYAHWLGQEAKNKRALVLVAVTRERKPKVIGYAYARLEGRDWWLLRDACGILHDLVVAEGYRGHHVGSKLLDEVKTWMKERGAPRLVLETATANVAGQAFFRKHGCRPTLMEMALELGESKT